MCLVMYFFFFNDTATTEIYTLSLHDALPISSTTPPTPHSPRPSRPGKSARPLRSSRAPSAAGDRKSTRLNSSHSQISYAVFCLKKKKKTASSDSPITNTHQAMNTLLRHQHST